ncbi:MAG TPA: EAL domain-containing protein [Rhodanobacteraceae bacterium]
MTAKHAEAPAAADMLRASGRLWEAQDLDAVAAAAGDLLRELAPGTLIQRCARDASHALEETSGRLLQIPLSRQESLIVTPPGNRSPLLRAAAQLITARIDALARQKALKESNAQLGRAEKLQHALYAIADQASTADADINRMFKALHRIVGTLMYAENFFIALYDAHKDSVRFAYYADVADSDIPDPDTDMAMREILHGPTWYVINDAKPFMGSQVQLASQASGPYHASGAESLDWLGVPLMRGNEVVGCVVVQSYDDTHHFSEEDKTLLIYVAQHIQTALERRFAHAELEHRVNERTHALQQEVLERQRGERLQKALFRIAELAGSTDRIENFFSEVHGIVGDLLDARNFYVALISEDGTELTFPYYVDEREGTVTARKIGNGMTEYVMRHGTAVLADATTFAQLRGSGEVTMGIDDALCWLGVPLVCGEHTVGALAVQSYSQGNLYTPRDQELLTFVSYHIATALERIRAAESLRRAYAELEHRVDERTRDLRAQIAERERVEDRLKYETLHDSLTGLPNRAHLMQRLDRALDRFHAAPHESFAVLFLDLDRFKIINDSMGHLVGDELLVQVGKRIRACVKSNDVVARLGGDEFSVLLEHVSTTEEASLVATRIIEKLNAPFRLASREIFTSTSIGITLVASHYQNSDELLRDADSAMYRAKAQGRRRYIVFDHGLRREAMSELEIESDLRRGLARKEFVPYYQPIVDLETGDVLGYEALMRWRHPERGVLLPGTFLGVAEDTGLSEAIDWQIFEQACRDANALAGSRGAFVGVNLSARHFHNPHLDEHLLGLLAEYAVPPSHFHVEVTERALLENTPAVRRILHAFRSAGISISLDDFGTGYSSLSYLHQYPLQTLKIDRSFIANLAEDDESNNGAVIRAILAMAQTMSIKVIAEGVETEAQRDLLRKMGCHQVQGFLYAKAQPVDTWIRDVVAPLAAS